MLSRTRWARASSMPTTGLNRNRRSSRNRTMKLMACHNKPCQFNPSVLAIASIRAYSAVNSSSDFADEDERDHQGVDGDGFGEAEADQQWDQDRSDDLRVAANRLHGLAHAVADTNAWANRAEADGKGGRPHVRCPSSRRCLSEET